jgi:ribosomal protein S6
MVTFSAESDFPEELERNFKITENILKYLIIRKED